MRVLFLCPRPIWPLDSGAKLRDYHLARALATRFDVFLVHFEGPNSAPVCSTVMAPFAKVVSVPRARTYSPRDVLRGLVGRHPVSTLNYLQSTMREALSGVMSHGRFDSAHVSSIHMSGYSAQLEQHGVPVVFDWHNVESELMRRYACSARNPAKRLYAHLTAKKLATVEQAVLAKAAAVCLTSERERALLARIAPANVLHVVENGVDLASCLGPAGDESSSERRRNLLFVGSMDYHANIDAVSSFAAETWPQVRARLPHANLVVVGRSPPRAIAELHGQHGITVTGSVDDVKPYYRDALAAIVPLRVGGGTRLKILEALGNGVPVISTALGAEGLSARHGEDLLIAHTPEEWCRALDRLETEIGYRDRLVAHGYDLVRRQYDWSRIGPKLVAIHERAAACTGRNPATSV